MAILVCGWVAFVHHPIGDYFTESDFYGAYAVGARLLHVGTVDPGRYGVYGPVYEWVLAAAGFVVHDLFTAARLISVAAFGTTLAFWFVLIARRAGAYAGFWCALFLAANPVLFRYGYSATTDTLSVMLQSASLFALLGARGRRAPLWAGLLAGLAILTRYNLVYLVPASLICLWWPGERTEGRRRAIGVWILGCAVVVVPWTAYSLLRGHVPGEELFTNYGFYAASTSARHVQDWTEAARAVAERTSLLDVLRRDAPGLLVKWGRAAIEHLIRDLGGLVGWPTAALAAVGVVFAVVLGTWHRWTVLAAAGAFAFLSIVPVFYSDRYSLSPLPFYLAAAAIGVAAPLALHRLRTATTVLLALIALGATGMRIVDSVRLQRRVERDLPLEVLDSAPALAAAAPHGGRVISRKGHIGYYTGLDVVAFPRVDSLAELGRIAREEGAGFLYYSWLEAQLRPEFSYLLDTTGAVPGLKVLHATEDHPSVTYRIGPRFGEPPAWFANDTLRDVHTFRGLVRVQPDSLTWQPRIFLGVYDLMHGRPGEALRAGRGVVRARPRAPDGWLIDGEALMLERRYTEARRAYRRILEIHPDNLGAEMGLGRVREAEGQYAVAARIWRPLIDSAPAPALDEMIEVFEAAGDTAAASRARTRRAALLR